MPPYYTSHITKPYPLHCLPTAPRKARKKNASKRPARSATTHDTTASRCRPRCSRRLRRRSPWACCCCANASAIRSVVGNAGYNTDATYTGARRPPRGGRARRSPPRPASVRPVAEEGEEWRGRWQRRRCRWRERSSARGTGEGSPGTFGAPPHSGPGPLRGGGEATREVCAGCPASPCYRWIFRCADG